MSSSEQDFIHRSILLVEDDAGLSQLICDELAEVGYRVTTAGSAEEAAQALTEDVPDLVISDMRLPGKDGLFVLQESRRAALPPAFIAITAFGTVEQAVDALKRGADNFLTKPLNLDHLQISVRNALEKRHLQSMVREYQQVMDSSDFHGIIGRSSTMRALYQQMRKVAVTNGPVLITGESGVGKELVARAIHAESGYRDGPFIAINCAGIPPDLLESELFGHAAGAFTGANRARKGMFAEAEGGTIMLDEIGEMPSAMQSKLLRILQDGQFRPVGENHERRLNMRVIAATNRDLEEDIQQGAFREDLYFRLETFALDVPPLRFRGDDIELLAAHFVAHFARDGQSLALSPETLSTLKRYPFPGNVRELSNSIQRAVAFCDGHTITPDDLPQRIRNHAAAEVENQKDSLMRRIIDSDDLPTLKELESRYVQYALERLEGNKRRTAEVLAIGRRTLYRYLNDEPSQS